MVFSEREFVRKVGELCQKYDVEPRFFAYMQNGDLFTLIGLTENNEDNERYRFGEYVAYMRDSGSVEIGRVVEDMGDSCFVCYTSGCTSVRTLKKRSEKDLES